jgi:hypothetical protein
VSDGRLRRSIIWIVGILTPFERLFDDAEQIEAEQRERDQDLTPPAPKPGDPPVYRCRVCGHESEDRSYCPDCLADTMVLKPAPRPGRSAGTRRP